MGIALSIRHIKKSFSGVTVLNDISLDIMEGEVHAIVGENGAGKSTLMKIIDGIYQPDNGELYINGERMKFNSSLDALKHGIAMVHQELMPVLNMTVAENIFLGREPVFQGCGIVNKKEMILNAKLLLKKVGLNINPMQKMHELNMAQMQLVEIAKAISCNAKVIIMDEPTSAITERESNNLFKQIRELQEKNVSVIYISHKLDEIFSICDRIAVLRDGQLISNNLISETDANKMITEMVGREMNTIYPAHESMPGDVLLEVRNLNIEGVLKNISFSVRHGEILGIAGLMGAGRTEIAESIFGLRKCDSIEVYKEGRKIDIRVPSDAIRNGIALVPEDRKMTGLSLIASVENNMAMASLSNYTKFGIVNKKQIRSDCNEMIRKMNIKTTGYSQIVNNLSGGNQQKIVIGKWLLTHGDIIILDDPTRGIDVSAKYEIYMIMQELAKQGKAVIMISSEMPEIIGVCDRVIVMYEGRITGELQKLELTQERIMRYASGYGE